MSTLRSSQCLLCAFSRSTSRSARKTCLSRRTAHIPSSTSLLVRHSSSGSKGRVSTRPVASLKNLRGYNEEERKRLLDKYSSAQRAAIDAGEKVIDLKNLASQALPRRNPWSLKYFDDLSKIDPVVDHPIRAPYSNTDPNKRLKTDDEINEDLARFIVDLPEDEESPEALEAWTEYDKGLRVTVGKEESERNTRSARGPDLFRPGEPNLHGEPVNPEEFLYGPKKGSKLPGTSNESMYQLIQMTGLTEKELRELRFKTVIFHPVVNQTRLGKIRQYYSISIAGDGNGLVGYGEAKGLDASAARMQSQQRAIRNMRPILRHEQRTIYGDLKGKVGGTEIELYNRPPGFGVRCQQYIWEICKCAGITDIAARVTRSRNPMNTVKATMAALLSQKDPEEIARARGRKLVDVRKVYYAGLS